MTDLEKVKTLFEELGIGFILDNVTSLHPESTLDDDIIIISCPEGNKKISGYNQFCTDFTFNKDGSFIEMGAWE